MSSLNYDDYESERKMMRDIFSLFVIEQRQLDKNLWMLTQRSKGGLDMRRAENLPFWRYEQFVEIANEIAEDEKKEREKQQEEQKASSNYNPSSYLNNISSMANKFKS